MKLPENILPLLDGDWVCYMACAAIEYKWGEKQEEKGLDPDSTPPFGDIVDVLEFKIKEIKHELETEVDPIIFFSGKKNFREEVAITKVYKGNRVQEKPFHYQNLKNYIEARYDTQVEDTLEADDLMSITQELYERWDGVGADTKSCIVTVDKDLRQVNGWHYSPEGHNFGSFGPRYCTNANTYIEPKDPEKISKGLIGTGYKFFYAQMIIGDTVDNVPGLPRHGPKVALKILADCETERQCYEAVRDAYRDACIMADDYFKEQAYLLWMIRSFNEEGLPVMWEEPV